MKIQIKKTVVAEEKEIETPAYFKDYGQLCKITENSLVKVSGKTCIIYKDNEIDFKLQVVDVIKGEVATEAEFHEVFGKFLSAAYQTAGLLQEA